MEKFQRSRKRFEKKDRLLAIASLSRFAKLDIGREKRKGLPEVVLAEGKIASDVAKISHAMLRRTGRAVISRLNGSQVRAIRSIIGREAKVEYFSRSQMLVIRSKSYRPRRSGGKVGILTAGTSDIPVAEEAEIIAREMGCETRSFYDIGVAVGTERGLVVPVVRGADKKSFADLERNIADYAGRAREGKLKIEDLRGGTFTITNGGVYGSLFATPILNFPQSGILGMHKIMPRPVAVDGKVNVRPMMYLALSYDHRAIDGKEAVTFLIKVKECIEDPKKLPLDF